MKRVLLFIFFLHAAIACKKSADGGPTPPPIVITPGTSSFAKGGDISWLTEMEAAGLKFYTSAGAEQDCMQLLKNLGMNAVRLRVWVNPANGWCNTSDVIAKAVRAKTLGLKILLNFHYSDDWADPGHQTKPAAWAAQDFAGLQSSVYNYTLAVLNSLKSAGITPEWAAIGNETNDGMLWPDGKASANMANFALLINAGYNAVKSVDTSIKVIIHISNGFDNGLYRWLFDGLMANGAKWDIIGMSLYPDVGNWSTLNTQCLANMTDMVSRYGKPVMICEAGMSWDQASACHSFLTDIINKTRSVAGGKGLGVFYWEPESYNNWKGYTLGAFDNSGKASIALNAFN
jgi:arabinogalactan endo-1,4-beta-galactosidase